MKRLAAFSGLAFTLWLGVGRAQAATVFTYDSPGSLVSQTVSNSVAPEILSPPLSRILSADGNVNFTVLASGPGPLAYQWLSNGVPIPGATGEVFNITNVVVPKNVVSNGSFELPPVLVPSLNYVAGHLFSGWQVETGNVDHVFSSSWISADGFQSMDLNGTAAGAIFQDVPTTPGQAYFLRYAIAGNPAASPVLKTNVAWWDGAVLATNTANITGRSYDDMGWTNYEYAVTATGNPTRLKFASLSTGGAGPALDDVSLIALPPSPAQYSVIVSNSSGSVTSTVATIEFDTDRNGLPDAWERTYFALPGQPPSADRDGDGVSNLDEYRDGTNPTNSASVRPRLNITAWPGGAVGVQAMRPSYALNESVQLAAQSQSGVTFIAWNGSITNTNPVVNLVMNGTKSVNAIFGYNLLNGTNADGGIEVGSTNTYAFPANAGDTIVLRCGQLAGTASFAPWLRLYGPGAVLVSSVSHASDAYLAYRATNSGMFSVTVTSTGTGQSGDYRLRFMRLPAAYVVPAGDEGGTLTNGGNVSGTNDLGDEDLWTFTANSGDNVVLRCADTSGGASYLPWVRLYGPDGALLASDADAADSYVAYRATNSGTFSVLVGSATAGFTGSYLLRFAQMPGVFTIPPGDEGGTLVNGGNHDGTNDLGDEDMWSFSANTGDSVVLRCGKLSGTASYYPWVRIYGPNGALLAQDNDATDAYVAYRMTNSGSFTVLVGSAYAGNTGAYRLRFMQIPGAFIVPPGDEGGAMTSGGNHDGTNDLGDEDIWTFTANTGDNLVLRCGETSGVGSYAPWIRLYGPTGALLSQNNNATDAYLAYQATNSGTFTVLIGSANAGYTGTYRLRLMRMPGAFSTPPGDEGGALSNGGNHDGVTDIGDEDPWTFTANAGENVILRCGELSGTASYTPWLRLYGPNGALLAQDNDATDARLAYQTTNSGTFTVLVGSSTVGHTGTYRLRFGRLPGAFSTPPGDEGGALTNGAAHEGITSIGDEDLWSLSANAGDTIVLRCADSSGNTGYYPYLRLYGPNGVLLAADTDQSDAWITHRATNSGPFTAVVGSYYQGYTGTYRLRLAQVPGAFVVPPGDEGGALVNGGNHDGTNELGDEDIWTFTANNGDNIVLRCADVSTNSGYYPYLRLYGSNGALLDADADQTDSFLAYRATNSGPFTVLVGSYYQGYAANYRLRFMQMPGTFVVPVGDDGGAISPGVTNNATTDLADEDAWSFTGFNNVPLVLNCQRIAGTITPWMRLYSPTGVFLREVANATLGTINYTPTNTGTFTVLVGSYYRGQFGTYRLYGSGAFTAGLKLGTPSISGSELTIPLTGGYSNLQFTALMTTNLTPPVVWSPTLTNQFDPSGNFTLTNTYSPSQPQKYLRVSLP